MISLGPVRISASGREKEISNFRLAAWEISSITATGVPGHGRLLARNVALVLTKLQCLVEVWMGDAALRTENCAGMGEA
jgi:hypothetical protein